VDASENTIMMKTLKFGTHISKGFSLFLIGGFMLAGCGGTTGQPASAQTEASLLQGDGDDHANNPYWSTTDTTKLNVSPAEWRKILSPELFHIAFESGTDAPFTGKYTDYKGKGIFVCAVCGHPLFDATTGFHSGTGWPSFYQPLAPTSVEHVSDGSHGMERTEIVCARCGAHLGHVFDDGPKPTGLRYCMNSTSLVLERE
jgi:peptide-methionine (R)-S-oxide reductase